MLSSILPLYELISGCRNIVYLYNPPLDGRSKETKEQHKEIDEKMRKADEKFVNKIKEMEEKMSKDIERTEKKTDAMKQKMKDKPKKSFNLKQIRSRDRKIEMDAKKAKLDEEKITS
nr:2641_t:CDS:1 [Entrophospora candida]CAG8512335.1 9560_t:CDS:1 [Entrophospora candida]